MCVSLISLREQQTKTTVGLPIIHTHIPTLFSVTNTLFFKFLFHLPSLSSSFFRLQNWELLLISKLEWNINAVTAYDYVDHILERVKWGSDDARLREHAHTLIHVCNTGKEG